MSLSEDLERIAAAAHAFALDGEELAAVIATETGSGARTYLCAFVRSDDGARSWLALDDDGRPLMERARVRDAAAMAAMCELAEESAGGGDLSELRSQLVTLRLTENPPGIDEAEDAALALEQTVGAQPRVASPGYLDAVGAATLRLERALGSDASSPFAVAMRGGMNVVDELANEVEGTYKVELR